MATEILRPNAAGDETTLTPYGATNNWECVDEETPDDDTTRVYNSIENGYKRDLYNLPAHSEGSGTINFIKIYFRCRCTISGAVKPSFKSNGTVTDGTEIDNLTAVYTTYSQQWNTNPADGEAWEWADIDALQIGVSLRVWAEYATARCTQVYVEVDYTAGGATEKQSSDSGTGTDAKASGNPVASINGSETGSGADSLPARDIALPDTGSGVDAYVSLQTPAAKSSSDTGSGVEGTPLPSAILAGSETGSGIEALIFRLLAAVDTGGGVEAGVEIEGLLKNLFASELGEGSDCLAAKIETPTKGGGMKLWI